MNFMLIKDFIPNSHNLLNLKNKILSDEETRNFIINPKNFKYFFYKNFEDTKFKGIDGFEFLEDLEQETLLLQLKVVHSFVL